MQSSRGTLTPAEMAHLLTPFLPTPSDSVLSRLSLYLDLLLKWNARTNLTAIHSPEEIVTRHFGESLFAAGRLGSPGTLLDYGSGAGFPGIPIAILCPSIAVTLAESQNKKAAFLREAVRRLGLRCTVWGGRVEDFPSDTIFEAVTMRAVDRMEAAVAHAATMAPAGIHLLTTFASFADLPPLIQYTPAASISVPLSMDRILVSLHRTG